MSNIALITKALESPRVIDENATIVHNFICALIPKIYAIAGQAPESSDAQRFMVLELKKDVLTRFKGLTLQEVEIALTNGVKGDYGEYYGLNIRSFNKFLNEYTFSEERGKAIESRMTRVTPDKQLSAKGSITREETERTAYSNAIDLFESYKQTKKCPDHGNVVYNYLDRLGVIKIDNKEKWDIFNEAKKFREKERKIYGKTSIISDVIEKQQEGGIVVAYAKKIALKQYFGVLVEKGIELKTVLDKKRKN